MIAGTAWALLVLLACLLLGVLLVHHRHRTRYARRRQTVLLAQLQIEAQMRELTRQTMSAMRQVVREADQRSP